MGNSWFEIVAVVFCVPIAEYRIKGGMIFHKCYACGAKETVDMSHKVRAFFFCLRSWRCLSYFLRLNSNGGFFQCTHDHRRVLT